MPLYTIVDEYDVLYAQDRELADVSFPKQETLSTNPQDFLENTKSDYVTRLIL